MAWFRPNALDLSSIATLDDVRQIVDRAVRPSHFFVASSLRLTWDHQSSDPTHWELFRGRALDETQTRNRRTFETWNLREPGDSPPTSEPLISVKLDWPARAAYVTRSIACRAFETYADGNAILSRETVRRVRELVGTIDFSRLTTCAEIEDELIALLFFAVTGTSRLPLTSLEAPMPAFTFGQLAYCRRSGFEATSSTCSEELLRIARHPQYALIERSRALEAALRAESVKRVSDLAASFAALYDKGNFDRNDLPILLREVFNNIALSPYTDFVAKALRFAQCLLQDEDEVDFVSHLLRQIGRHLTSFDLVRFHHRGANYPDALLLDEVLARAIELLDRMPRLFLADPADDAAAAKRKRLRRRGLRSAWLICRQYHGYPVPDAPTSPGENKRLLPEPFAHVPEEQIVNPAKRTKRLFLNSRFEGRPTMRQALRQSASDLVHESERTELGLGIFLDRPFGFAKELGEPDRTTMLSHEAFSLTIATSRLELLREMDAVPGVDFEHVPPGIPSEACASSQRPGTASVRDAWVSVQDFRFLATTRRAVRDMLAAYDFSPLRESGLLDWLQSERVLILPSPESVSELVVYAVTGRERIRLQMDASRGYCSRAGMEALAAGLIVLSASDECHGTISNALRLPSQV